MFMTGYIPLIKLSEVQFGRNITRMGDLKSGRAKGASSIINKYDYKQKPRVSRSRPLYDSHFESKNSVGTNILLVLLHIFFLWETEVMPFRACLHGGGGPQEGEVTRLSISSIILI